MCSYRLLEGFCLLVAAMMLALAWMSQVPGPLVSAYVCVGSWQLVRRRRLNKPTNPFDIYLWPWTLLRGLWSRP